MIDLMFAIGGGIFIGGVLIKSMETFLSIPRRRAERRMRQRLLDDLNEAHTEMEKMLKKEKNGKGQADKKQNRKVRPTAQGKSKKTSNKS